MIPSRHLIETPIFHITHVNNLEAVLRIGQLVAKNNLDPGSCESIANEEIQGRRARLEVSVPPGGLIHDYVPFYFAPRSPMLYCNHMGSIDNASPQGEIIYLASTAQRVNEAGHAFVFYDRHAVVRYAQVYNDLNSLNQIDWRIFFEPPLVGGYAKYWMDRVDDDRPHWMNRKEVRQAEFLVHQRVTLSCIQEIGTYNSSTKARVKEILKLHDFTCKVSIQPDWYYSR